MEPGQKLQEKIEIFAGGKMLPGDDLLMIGYTGLQGTQQLYMQYREFIRQRFSSSWLRKMLDACEPPPVQILENSEDKEGRCYTLEKGNGEKTDFRARMVFPLGEEGVLSGLWILSQASHTGLCVDLRAIPLKQETIELCECLEQNPYKLPSKGAWLIAAENGFALMQKLRIEGLNCTCIGTVQEGKKKLLLNKGNVRYLEKPPVEELWKICSGDSFQ